MSQTRTNRLYRTSDLSISRGASSVEFPQPSEESDEGPLAEGYGARGAVPLLLMESVIRTANWSFEPEPSSRVVTYYFPFPGQAQCKVLDLTDALALFDGESAPPDQPVFSLRPSSKIRVRATVRVQAGRLSLVAPDELGEAE